MSDATLLNIGGVWKEVRPGWEVLFDYPVGMKKYKLEEIISDGIDFEVPRDAKTGLLDYNKLTKAQRVKAFGNMNKYNDYYLKCTIKDWRGDFVKDVPCIIKNDELDDRLWSRIINDNGLRKEFIEAMDSVQWDSSSKKKSISMEDSNVKAV